jgi:hypothetical protein
MSKPTPGPWAVGPRRQHEIPIRSAAMPGLEPIVTKAVAIRDGEGEANARLIAAAPDLLDALFWALSQIEDDLDPDHQAALASAWAAIAKATGEKT